MKAQLIKVVGTERYPFACVIEIGNIWVTDRICNQDKANKIVKYVENSNNIKDVRFKLAMSCVELRMNMSY